MMIKNFLLLGYKNIYNQVIIGGSEIKIILDIINYNNKFIIVDISNYSYLKKIKLNFIEKEKNISRLGAHFKVDFLGDFGLNCGKKNKNSRVFFKVANLKYFSNTIGNYIYSNDVDGMFHIMDHHLGVYNKYNEEYKKQSVIISEYKEHKNDIIFINRSPMNMYLFINLDDNINAILIKYLNNLKKNQKSIFYINIFNIELNTSIKNNINKIFNVCKSGSFYIYNIDNKYLEKFNFNKNFLLYNYHFPPIYIK